MKQNKKVGSIKNYCDFCLQYHDEVKEAKYKINANNYCQKHYRMMRTKELIQEERNEIRGAE